MKPAEVRKRARARAAELERLAHDPRYLRVIGRLVREGLLVANHEVPAFDGPFRLDEALFAGSVEPRVLELLPALILKQPSLLVHPLDVPADLLEVLKDLRSQRRPRPFRGIPGEDMERWLPRTGRKGKLPSRLKSFRFTAEDQRLLRSLADELELSETEVIRRGLRALI